VCQRSRATAGGAGALRLTKFILCLNLIALPKVKVGASFQLAGFSFVT